MSYHRTTLYSSILAVLSKSAQLGGSQLVRYCQILDDQPMNTLDSIQTRRSLRSAFRPTISTGLQDPTVRCGWGRGY